MNDRRIKILEEKYWRGETSLEEERELRSVSESRPDELSPEFVQLAASLRCESGASAQQLDDAFETEFWAAVEEVPDSKVVRGRFTPLHFVRYAAAAVVFLCFSFAIWYAVEEKSAAKQSLALVQSDGQFESPEKAFEEAKKALAFASSKLNKVKKPVRKIEKFHQATLSVAGMNYNRTVKDSTNENNK